MTSPKTLRYHFHGVDITSEIDLDLPPTRQQPSGRHLVFGFSSRPAPELGAAIWQDSRCFADGQPWFSLYLHDCRPAYLVHGTGLFIFEPERIDIFAEPSRRLLPYLLGRLFGLWLELSGTVVLHGSCLAFGDQARAFLGFSRAGKSTLSAALNQRGHRLICDDMIPLEPAGEGFEVQPGFPQSRLWPDSGRRFVVDFESFPRVHPSVEKRKIPGAGRGPANFATRGRRLDRIYILNRVSDSGAAIGAEPLTPAQALTELIAMSSVAQELEALGLAKRRLGQLAGVVERSQVYRLTYPTGYERLPHVCDYLDAD